MDKVTAPSRERPFVVKKKEPVQGFARKRAKWSKGAMRGPGGKQQTRGLLGLCKREN